MRELIDSAAKTDRPIAPHLSGFAYSPQAPTYRNGTPSDQEQVPVETLIMQGQADHLRELTKNGRSAAAVHDRGIANLMLGDSAAAVSDLTRAANAAAKNATYWSDLSAALYEAGLRNPDDKTSLQRAIEAADHAIQLDPKLSAAYFNRAWASAALHPQQRAAIWKDYLAHDATGPWAAEARKQIKDSTEQ
jgi:tetratricopeptide (TPR) repeat protein